MSEHILWETIDEQKEKIADLEKENRLLGERCNQLLKDKGNLTDELQELKETLAHTVENDEVAYETLKLHDQEEIGMLNSKVTELENKIADIKANCDLAIEGRDIKIKELEEENNKLLDVISNYEVKITDLEKQIEKMKCCGNCKQRELIREHGQWKERFNCKGNGCVCYNKWRLKND